MEWECNESIGTSAIEPDVRGGETWKLSGVSYQSLGNRVEYLAAGQPPQPPVESFPEAAFLLTSDADQRPCLKQPEGELPLWLFAETPRHLAALKETSSTLALDWRLALRSAMQTALSHNYVAVDFLTTDQRCFYAFRSA